MFNRIAGTYDLLNDCMTGGMHRWWKQQACRSLKLQPGDTVLDVCTGTGDLAFILSKIVGPQGQVVALDFSEEMLAIAHKRFSKAANITWVQGDALNLPFETDRFQGAIISFGLRNVSSVPQTLSEMARVIRPGGRVVNLDTASDCQNPLFWLYFSKVMPALGRILSQDQDAYRYLCQSARTFETPAGIAAHLQELGLLETHIQRFALGSVSLQSGIKPELS
jgi:demethylmenaquinone methyltransferase / 2-methoxy-6-polyprenyl-1,4-benzoquinol methylase